MTEALFLHDLDGVRPGDDITLTGDEGRHAVTVRRIHIGETILIADGAGTAARGPVIGIEKSTLTMHVDELITAPEKPLRFVAVQALAKGDRAELAVEVLTELGIDEIVPWQSSRSIVKWVPERAERQLAKWRNTAREATKQSRRLRVPIVSWPMTTAELAQRIPNTTLTLVLHEDAATPLTDLELPASGEVMLIIGPEGGLSPEELSTFEEAGGKPVTIADGVLRTSTAGVVALAQVQALTASRA